MINRICKCSGACIAFIVIVGIIFLIFGSSSNEGGSSPPCSSYPGNYNDCMGRCYCYLCDNTCISMTGTCNGYLNNTISGDCSTLLKEAQEGLLVAGIVMMIVGCFAGSLLVVYFIFVKRLFCCK